MTRFQRIMSWPIVVLGYVIIILVGTAISCGWIKDDPDNEIEAQSK